MDLHRFAFLVMPGLMLAASIGLLLRRNWGRMLFVALMILGIVWNVAGFAFMFLAMGAFDSMRAAADAGLHAFAYVMIGFNVLLGLGVIALMAWIVKRLLSPAVRAEFAGA